MFSETVHLRGYNECIRALNKINRDIAKDVKDELAKVAEPIAADTRSRLSRYQGASISTIKPSVRTTGVYVRQNKRKVTGKRADFGALQMTRGFMPALEAHGGDVEKGVGDAFDSLVRRAGFH